MTFLFKKMYRLPLLVTAVLELLLFQLEHWNNAFLGWVLLTLFVICVGLWWEVVLDRLYRIPGGRWSSRILAWFAVFLLLSLVSSLFVVLNRLGTPQVWLSYVVTAVLSFGAFSFATKVRPVKRKRLAHHRRMVYVERRPVYIALFVLLWIVSFVLLAGNASTDILTSPWQQIHSGFLPVFFLLSFLLSLMLFSRFSVRLLLLFIVAHTLLLHLYLPLSHQLPWGGDVWRHIANEQQLVDEAYIYPTLVDADGLVAEPTHILSSPQKLSYGQLWGATTVLHRTTGLDLLAINRWLVPVLWSIVVPIIFYALGRLLFHSKQRGLWLAMLSSLPFSLQALGALTLPVSLGYISFFFVLLLWLSALHDRRPAAALVPLSFGALLSFGYALHVVLFWGVAFASLLLLLIRKVPSPLWRVAAVTTLFFASLFFLPTIELGTNISFVPEEINLLENGKQMVGQLSGWYFASAIRPHDILAGNIFINHTPAHAFVSNFFSDFRWPLLILIPLTWLGAAWGVIRRHSDRHKLVWDVLTVLLLIVLGGYLLGWYVLDGDRLLTRRLDGALAILLLIFFSRTVSYMSVILQHLRKRHVRPMVLIGLLSYSWFAVVAFASGPDMRVVSVAEYTAAEHVWEQQEVHATSHCILADTWTLLALEAVSTGQIVGGGFPIDYQFGQPERVVLYSELLREPREGIATVATGLTGSESCTYVFPQKPTNPEQREVLQQLAGERVSVSIGPIELWEVDLKKAEE